MYKNIPTKPRLSRANQEKPHHIVKKPRCKTLKRQKCVIHSSPRYVSQIPPHIASTNNSKNTSSSPPSHSRFGSLLNLGISSQQLTNNTLSQLNSAQTSHQPTQNSSPQAAAAAATAAAAAAAPAIVPRGLHWRHRKSQRSIDSGSRIAQLSDIQQKEQITYWTMFEISEKTWFSYRLFPSPNEHYLSSILPSTVNITLHNQWRQYISTRFDNILLQRSPQEKAIFTAFLIDHNFTKGIELMIANPSCIKYLFDDNDCSLLYHLIKLHNCDGVRLFLQTCQQLHVTPPWGKSRLHPLYLALITPSKSSQVSFATWIGNSSSPATTATTTATTTTTTTPLHQVIFQPDYTMIKTLCQYSITSSIHRGHFMRYIAAHVTDVHVLSILNEYQLIDCSVVDDRGFSLLHYYLRNMQRKLYTIGPSIVDDEYDDCVIIWDQLAQSSINNNNNIISSDGDNDMDHHHIDDDNNNNNNNNNDHFHQDSNNHHHHQDSNHNNNHQQDSNNNNQETSIFDWIDADEHTQLLSPPNMLEFPWDSLHQPQSSTPEHHHHHYQTESLSQSTMQHLSSLFSSPNNNNNTRNNNYTNAEEKNPFVGALVHPLMSSMLHFHRFIAQPSKPIQEHHIWSQTLEQSLEKETLPSTKMIDLIGQLTPVQLLSFCVIQYEQIALLSVNNIMNHSYTQFLRNPHNVSHPQALPFREFQKYLKLFQTTKYNDDMWLLPSFSSKNDYITLNNAITIAIEQSNLQVKFDSSHIHNQQSHYINQTSQKHSQITNTKRFKPPIPNTQHILKTSHIFLNNISTTTQFMISLLDNMQSYLSPTSSPLIVPSLSSSLSSSSSSSSSPTQNSLIIPSVPTTLRPLLGFHIPMFVPYIMKPYRRYISRLNTISSMSPAFDTFPIPLSDNHAVACLKHYYSTLNHHNNNDNNDNDDNDDRKKRLQQHIGYIWEHIQHLIPIYSLEQLQHVMPVTSSDENETGKLLRTFLTPWIESYQHQTQQHMSLSSSDPTIHSIYASQSIQQRLNNAMTNLFLAEKHLKQQYQHTHDENIDGNDDEDPFLLELLRLGGGGGTSEDDSSLGEDSTQSTTTLLSSDTRHQTTPNNIFSHANQLQAQTMTQHELVLYDVQIIDYLLLHGANPRQQSSSGHSAFDVVQTLPNTEYRAFLSRKLNLAMRQF